MKRILGVVSIIIVISLFPACKERQPQQKEGFAPAPAPFISAEQIRGLEQAAAMDPKNPAGWIALGNALMDSKQFAGAIDAYEKALKLDAKNVDVRVDMGTCYWNAGKPERAVEEFRKAMKINPNHAYAHRNAGVVLAQGLHKPQEAAKEFEKYLELAPNAPDAADMRLMISDLKSGKMPPK